MDFETVDIIFRSRQTLLNILKTKGYNVKPYLKFGPFEIETMLAGSKETALRMELESEVETEGVLPKCRVEYAFSIKNRINSFLKKLIEDEDGNISIDPDETSIIVVTLDPIGESFNKAALSAWNTNKLRISFFDANTIVNNPLDHVLVPKHELFPYSKHTEFMKAKYISSKNTLPIIKFHEDIIARILGLVPGDIVKITRPSPQAGLCETYRICTI
jgi:DNA-directed RNA polymerase subunit H (RpoH/RPB5)